MLDIPSLPPDSAMLDSLTPLPETPETPLCSTLPSLPPRLSYAGLPQGPLSPTPLCSTLPFSPPRLGYAGLPHPSPRDPGDSAMLDTPFSPPRLTGECLEAHAERHKVVERDLATGGVATQHHAYGPRGQVVAKGSEGLLQLVRFHGPRAITIKTNEGTLGEGRREIKCAILWGAQGITLRMYYSQTSQQRDSEKWPNSESTTAKLDGTESSKLTSEERPPLYSKQRPKTLPRNDRLAVQNNL